MDILELSKEIESKMKQLNKELLNLTKSLEYECAYNSDSENIIVTSLKLDEYDVELKEFIKNWRK